MTVCSAPDFFSVRAALALRADERPGTEDALVAGFPARIIGFDGQAGVKGEVQAGLVLEVDADGVVVRGDVEFDGVDGLAFCFRETKELAWIGAAG